MENNSVRTYLHNYSRLLGGVIIALIFCQGCGTTKGAHTRPSYTKDKETAVAEEAEKEKRGRAASEDTLEAEKKELEDLSALLASPAVESPLKKTVDSYIGTPYKYGGVSKNGMDCSGFVWRVFTEMGKNDFPRTSSAKLSSLGIAVSRNRIKPGDLLFFRRGRRIDHVGIYMGEKIFVHASPKKGVMYTSMDSDYFKHRLVCIRRM